MATQMLKIVIGGPAMAPCTATGFIGSLLGTRHRPRTVRVMADHVRVGPHAYYTADSASVEAIGRCIGGIAAGLHVSVLVPEAQVERTRGMAAAFGVEDQIAVFAAERFVSQVLVGLSVDKDRNPADILGDVLREWNRSTVQQSGSLHTD